MKLLSTTYACNEDLNVINQGSHSLHDFPLLQISMTQQKLSSKTIFSTCNSFPCDLHFSSELLSQVPLTHTLPKKKCNIQKNYQICISCNGNWAILWKSLGEVYSDYWVYWDNWLIFFDGVFCLLLPGAFPLVDMIRGHWPWSRATIKNLEIKLAFLMGKSVQS